MSSEPLRPIRRDLWRDRAGTSAVEFAIVAPAFLATLFGVLALGWALHCNESVDHAAQTVARELISNPQITQSQLQTDAQGVLTGIADPTNVNLTLAEDPTTASPRLAHLNVTYTHVLGGPFIPGWKYTYNAQSTVTLSP